MSSSTQRRVRCARLISETLPVPSRPGAPSSRTLRRLQSPDLVTLDRSVGPSFSSSASFSSFLMSSGFFSSFFSILSSFLMMVLFKNTVIKLKFLRLYQEWGTPVRLPHRTSLAASGWSFTIHSDDKTLFRCSPCPPRSYMLHLETCRPKLQADGQASPSC